MCISMQCYRSTGADVELGDSYDWVMWRANSVLSRMVWRPPQVREMVAIITKRPRQKHWSAAFQHKFSAWVSGKGEYDLSSVLGYTREDVRHHLERQFSANMSWRNYAGGRGRKRSRVWHIDHIVAKSRFGCDEIKEAFALTNLRPLWAKDNFSKAARRIHLL